MQGYSCSRTHGRHTIMEDFTAVNAAVAVAGRSVGGRRKLLPVDVALQACRFHTLHKLRGVHVHTTGCSCACVGVCHDRHNELHELPLSQAHSKTVAFYAAFYIRLPRYSILRSFFVV